MTSKYSLYIYNKYRRYLFSKKYILPKLINGGGGGGGGKIYKTPPHPLNLKNPQKNKKCFLKKNKQFKYKT
ncbi:hypothetical protein, partial [Escherichia coli]|uniref:hypothetical protein n=1 Tax=Escherichia coli TaxID=562 RepID=UPI00301D9957